MSDQPGARDAAELLFHLRRRDELSHRRVAGQELPQQMALLRKWQVERLAQTHADLLRSERYGPACRFFLSDVYAPRDFTQRNHDIVRMHNFMLRFLPARVIQTLTLTIALNTLTEELDDALLAALVNELGVTDAITPALYAEAYRLCDNYDARADQIRMVSEIGRGIDRLVTLPLVEWTLQLARRPARRGGWDELQSFLERGFNAFKHARGADEFLQTVERREFRILDQIYAGANEPFAIDS